MLGIWIGLAILAAYLEYDRIRLERRFTRKP
jgi:hypothetical protein